MAYFEDDHTDRFDSLIKEAMLAAAMSVTKNGAVPSIPKLEELKTFPAE